MVKKILIFCTTIAVGLLFMAQLCDYKQNKDDKS